MDREIIFTVLAGDRPGIAESVSRIVSESGGNWMKSRMIQMAGKFAGIIQVECPEEDGASLESNLLALDREGIRIILDDVFAAPADSPCAGAQPAGSHPTGAALGQTPLSVHLSVTANDRPGIVREVTGCLAAIGGNVVELDTDCRSGAMVGHTIFNARIDVDLPKGVGREALVNALHDLSDDVMVDIEKE